MSTIHRTDRFQPPLPGTAYKLPQSFSLILPADAVTITAARHTIESGKSKGTTVMVWYYAKGEQQLGPIEEAELQSLITSGAITGTDLVWRDGMPQWQPAATVFPGSSSESTSRVVMPAPPIGYFNPNEHLSQRFAGFWIRFVAVFLDGIILLAVGGVIGGIIGAALSATGSASEDVGNVAFLITQTIGYVIGWLYEALMLSKKGATLGKMALGIRVIRPDGARLSFGRATGRHFAKFLSGLTLLIGYIMAAFTEKKQALHDIICDTIVIRPNKGTP